MRAIAAGALLWLRASPAIADDPATVLRSFGLVGDWSVDCATDPRHEFGERSSYSAPPAGAPEYTFLAHGQFGLMAEQMRVVSATLVGADAIKLTLVPLRMKWSDPRRATPMDRRARQVVLKKFGGKLRVIDSRTTDGSQISVADGRSPANQPTPLVEKCAN